MGGEVMPYEDEIPPYGDLAEPPPELDRLAREVIGAAIEVHRHLGPGLPEEAYEVAVDVELSRRRIPFERQKLVDVLYKGIVVAKGRIDLLVGGRLVVELKSCDSISPIFRLQARSYMRILHEVLGLLINFN